MGQIIKFFIQYLIVLILIIGFGFWISDNIKHSKQDAENSKFCDQVFNDAFNLDDIEETKRLDKKIKDEVNFENAEKCYNGYRELSETKVLLNEKMKEIEKPLIK